ncbi:winged helix DNA-binding domain-containing protein [Propionibacteriaceae bacterium Y2011]
MRHIDDTERRARLARRHALHADHRVGDPVAATRAMTVLHATEAATVHLAVHARSAGTTAADVDHALYADRSLVKLSAMRSTQFVFPRDLASAALGSVSARVAETTRRVVIRDVERFGVADDGVAWLATARTAVLERLADGEPRSAKQLRVEVPELAGRFELDPTKKWGGSFHLAPRVLTVLAADGEIVRGPNAGPWSRNSPTWTLLPYWLGEATEPLPTPQGYAELVRRWLGTFGPGTEADVVWWLGATKTAVRTALADLGAVQVSLDGGLTGWVLPDDLDPVPSPGPWAALLPTLDPTTMGWRQRDFYLDADDVGHLFDSNGNAGNTAWWNGRIVGAWAQHADGTVQVLVRDAAEVPPEGRAALDAEASRLTEWLDGTVISNPYASRLMKGERLP